MPNLEYSLTGVTLSQSSAFQPQLNVRIDIKYPKYPGQQQPQPDWIYVIGMKGKLRVSANNSQWFEVGVTEQEQSFTVRLGEMATMILTIRLTSYLLHRIEGLRLGTDLLFQFEHNGSPLSIGYSGSNTAIDIINFQISGTGNTWKLPRSSWIDQLNATEFNKIDLIEVPKIDLPNIPLTAEVMKFLFQASKAMNEGRYNGVLAECRQVIDALDNGLEEWAKDKTLTNEQNIELEKIRQKQNGKKIGKREMNLSKLMGDSEKGARLGWTIGNLHYYLSLSPHEADHGSNFTFDDAKFVIHSVTSYASDILKHLSYKQT